MEHLHQVPVLLSHTNKLFIHILTEELARSGITKPQILVLQQLKDAPKTIGDISKTVDLSYSTVSGIIDRLERGNVVVRKKDEKDRRVVWVSLAEDSQQLKEKLPFLQENFFSDMFQGMTEKEGKQIGEALTLLNTYLERKYSTLCRERGRKDEFV